MRLIDADKTKEQIKQMDSLKPSERMLFYLALDRTPTYEPPNPPLTKEELREMDGVGVWCEDYQCDGIIAVDRYGRWAGIPFLAFRHTGVNCTYNIEERGLTIYRRKPEEEHDD